MVNRVRLGDVTPITGCGMGISVKLVPLSPRGEELAKERTLTVLEDTRGKENQITAKQKPSGKKSGKKGSR